MKFSQQLKASQIKEWKDHYVDYGKLKELMYSKFRVNKPIAPIVCLPVARSRSGLHDSLLADEDQEDLFEAAFDFEAAKVNHFFKRQLHVYTTETRLLHVQLSRLAPYSNMSISLESPPPVISNSATTSTNQTVENPQQKSPATTAVASHDETADFDDNDTNRDTNTNNDDTNNDDNDDNDDNYDNDDNGDNGEHAHHSHGDNNDNNGQKAKGQTSDYQRLNEPAKHQTDPRVNKKRSTLSAHIKFNPRDESSVRNAITDLYRRLHYLQSYAIVNYTAFVKILKKHDKVCSQYFAQRAQQQSQTQPRAYIQRKWSSNSWATKNATPLQHKLIDIERMDFFNSESLTSLVASLESVYSRLFCHGSITVARAELLMTKNTTSKRGQFWFGFKCGAATLMGAWVLWDCIVDAHLRTAKSSHWNEPCYRVYAGLGCLVLLMWLWAINLYVWRWYRINYIFILELSEKAPRASEAFSAATGMTFIFLTNLLLFYKAQRAADGDAPKWMGGWHSRIIPLALFIYMIFKAIFPWKTKSFAWRVVKNIICAPFSRVKFRDFYAADVWTSLVKPSVNIAFGLCYFGSGEFLSDSASAGICAFDQRIMKIVSPILSALPLWCRLMQCIRRYWDTQQRFPNLANAGKYALAQTVVILSVFASATVTDEYESFWIASLIASTLYTFSWDVKMDWALGSRSLKPDIFQLRDRLMFPHKWIYYVAIVADLLMRFLWTLTLVPLSAHSPLGVATSNLLQPFLASVELVRRSMWGCFRLEAEHLSNTEGFRTVDVIPLHFASPTEDQKEPDPPTWRTTMEVIAFCVAVVGVGILSLLLGQKWGVHS